MVDCLYTTKNTWCWLQLMATEQRDNDLWGYYSLVERHRCVYLRPFTLTNNDVLVKHIGERQLYREDRTVCAVWVYIMSNQSLIFLYPTVSVSIESQRIIVETPSPSMKLRSFAIQSLNQAIRYTMPSYCLSLDNRHSVSTPHV